MHNLQRNILLEYFTNTPGWSSVRLITEKTTPELGKITAPDFDMNKVLHEVWKSCLIFKHGYKGIVFYKLVPKETPTIKDCQMYY